MRRAHYWMKRPHGRGLFIARAEDLLLRRFSRCYSARSASFGSTRVARLSGAYSAIPMTTVTRPSTVP